MSKKSIFITGAASGIGLATAELFHAKGWFVAGYDIDLAALRKLEARWGDSCTTGYLDVRDPAAFNEAMALFSTFTDGQLDIMFNNAGITVGGFFDEIPLDKMINIVNVNLIGVLNGTYAAIPLLKQTEHSLCLTTCSSAAIFGAPEMAVYGATKYAVKGFTQAMSVELARHGVRAADVMPGIIDTPLWESNRYVDRKAIATYAKTPARNITRTDASRTISPSEVAKAVWQAYHQEHLHYYVPPELEKNELRSGADLEQRRDAMIAERRHKAP